MTSPLRAEQRDEWSEDEPEVRPGDDKEPPEKSGTQPDPAGQPVERKRGRKTAEAPPGSPATPAVQPGRRKEAGEGGTDPDPPLEPVEKEPADD